ncbi:MAG: stalk domain-containing protein [Eubacteriales bacterium]|nr:stalk domain-containing protein [Eubacteriales bacterium]
MRISELLEELDAEELNALLGLPESEAPAVSARAVRRRVSQTLDEDPIERRRHMKQLLKKGVCAALIAASLITASVAAYQTDFWKSWFPDGTGDLAVNTEKQSIDNGDIRLTLEQSLADDNMTFVVYSLTALTGQGKKLLYDENYVGGIDCAVSASYASPDGVVGYSMGSYPEQDTPEQRFFSLGTSDYSGPVTLHLRGSRQTITVPRTQNMPTVTINLQNAEIQTPDGSRCRLQSLDLTGMTYRLRYDRTYEPATGSWYDPEASLCFVLLDGTLQTAGQAGLEQASSNAASSTGRLSRLFAPDQLEGVVVNGTEYFADGRAPAAYSLPYDMSPVEAPTLRTDLNGREFLGTPLRALLEQFGGTVSWDSQTQSASVSYRGVTCVLTDGGAFLLRDGKQIETLTPAAKIFDGVMYIDSAALRTGLDVSVVGYRLRDAGFDYSRQTEDDSVIWLIQP